MLSLWAHRQAGGQTVSLIASTPCPSCGQYTLSIDAQERLACTLQPAFDTKGCPNPLLAHEILDRRGMLAREDRATTARRARRELQAERAKAAPDKARTIQ